MIFITDIWDWVAKSLRHRRFSKVELSKSMMQEIQAKGQVWSTINGGETGKLNTMWMSLKDASAIVINSLPYDQYPPGSRNAPRSLTVTTYSTERKARLVYMGGGGVITLQRGENLRADEVIVRLGWDGAPKVAVETHTNTKPQ